jgi:sigma-B regulation protein RsbU (phosphoserine phosphatase)
MSDLSNERLETLYKVSQALVSILDLEELLNVVMDQVIDVTGAERGFLMLGETGDELVFQVARGIDRNTIEDPEFQVSRGVIDRVGHEGLPIVTSDAQNEEWLAGRASVSDLNLRSVMCTPLQTQAKNIGLVYVDNRMQAGIFTPEDLSLLQAVANTAAVAIENARLHILAIERARLEQELEVARQVQSSIIPLEAPKVPGFEIAGLWRSAREVAGDFYDFIPRANGELAIVIGDVTDKGVPAAFFMALARTTVRACVFIDAPASTCIEQANRLICADSASGMFVTLYYLALHPDGRTITCVNAGHNLPIWLHAATAEMTMLPKGSVPLGIGKEYQYPESEVALEPGDLILLYTDGVIDAINDRTESFELERLTQTLLANNDEPLEGILHSIQQAVDAFAGETPPFDDFTLVAVRCVA